MGYLDFIDQVMYHFNIYCDENPVGDFQERLAEIEDENLSYDEYRAAVLSLRLANLIDPSRKKELEEFCEDLARLRHQGHLHGQTSLIDHDKLGSAFWTALDIRDDAGEYCHIHYNDSAPDEWYVHFFGYMKAEEKDTANFLLSARVEAFLNRLDSLAAAA